MADILIYGGVGLVILGVIVLIVIAFTKGLENARMMILLPVTMLFLITDKKGRWAWLAIGAGVALFLIGLAIDG